MAIEGLGIGQASGLPPNIVEKLMEAERIPLISLENTKAKVQNKLDLVEDLNTKVRDIRTAIGELASNKGFTDLKLISGDPNIIQGTIEPNSGAKGSWNVEVIQMAQKAAAISNGFPDKDETEIGVGYLSFETKEGTKEVYINGDNATLSGVAKTINRAGLGLQATVINDRKDPDYPYRLMISGKQVGDEAGIEYPTVYMLDGDMDFYFDEERDAKNGIIKIDGFEMQISDNILKDVIPGVVLDIKQASPGKVINVSVKEDQEVVSGRVKDFVAKMNEVLSFIQSQNRMNEKTDTSRTLGGDSMLRSVENRFRQLILGPVFGTGSSIQTLNQVGIMFNRQGTLEFDEDKFNGILAGNPPEVQKFFAGDGFTTGFINKLKSTISTLTDGTFGPISNKRRSLQNEIDRADQRIDSTERRLEQREKGLKRKFANLEEKMSRLNSQKSMIAARMGGLG